MFNGNYNSSTNDRSLGGLQTRKSYNWQTGINLSRGKFIKDNLLLSFNVGYTYSYRHLQSIDINDHLNNTKSESNTNTASAGISLLKYKFITENFAVYFGPSLSMSYSDGFEKDEGNHSYYTYDSLGNSLVNIVPYTTSAFQNSITTNINFNAGIVYLLNKNLALTGRIGFFSANYTASYYSNFGETQNSFGISLTPSFNAFGAGLVYFIRPKAKT